MVFMFRYQNDNRILFIFVIDQVRGAYQAAARLLRNIKDPKTRERFEQRQAALEKAIKRVDDAVKRGDEKVREGLPKTKEGGV